MTQNVTIKGDSLPNDVLTTHSILSVIILSVDRLSAVAPFRTRT